MLSEICMSSIQKLLVQLFIPSAKTEPPHQLTDLMDSLISLCRYLVKVQSPNINSTEELHELANNVLIQLMFVYGKKSEDATAKCIAKWCFVCPSLNVLIDNVSKQLQRKAELFNVMKNPARAEFAVKVKKIVTAREAMLAVA